MERTNGYGRRIAVTTDENAVLVDELNYTQEESPGIHKSPREITRNVGVSRSAVRRL